MQANLSDSIHIMSENQGTLSLLLKILGHHLTSRFSTTISWCKISKIVINKYSYYCLFFHFSTGLMVNVHHNISSLQPYIPFGFDTKSQVWQNPESITLCWFAKNLSVSKLNNTHRGCRGLSLSNKHNNTWFCVRALTNMHFG